MFDHPLLLPSPCRWSNVLFPTPHISGSHTLTAPVNVRLRYPITDHMITFPSICLTEKILPEVYRCVTPLSPLLCEVIWGRPRCGWGGGTNGDAIRTGSSGVHPSLLSRPTFARLSLEERVTKTLTETEGQFRDERWRKAVETALRPLCCHCSHPGTTPPPRSRCLRSPRPELTWPASSLLPRGHRFRTEAFSGSSPLPVSKGQRVKGDRRGKGWLNPFRAKFQFLYWF